MPLWSKNLSIQSYAHKVSEFPENLRPQSLVSCLWKQMHQNLKLTVSFVSVPALDTRDTMKQLLPLDETMQAMLSVCLQAIINVWKKVSTYELGTL